MNYNIGNLLISKLRHIVPNVRGGTQTESELITVFEDHENNPLLDQHSMSLFLDQRKQLLEIMNIYIEKVRSSEHISVSPLETADDNDCSNINKYHVIHEVSLFPKEVSARMLLNNKYGVRKEWFYNPDLLKAAGEQLDSFVSEANNSGYQGDTCFSLVFGRIRNDKKHFHTSKRERGKCISLSYQLPLLNI